VSDAVLPGVHHEARKLMIKTEVFFMSKPIN
jgi:hypothetical protein